MELKLIGEDFTVCKIKDLSGIDFKQKYLFLSITEDEISLVCNSNHLPDHVVAFEGGWVALKIIGILDFSLVGILSKISTVLAEKGISIFAISTYNTDYILLKSDKVDEGIGVLKEQGYQIM